jgi:hypothetical protein
MGERQPLMSSRPAAIVVVRPILVTMAQAFMGISPLPVSRSRLIVLTIGAPKIACKDGGTPTTNYENPGQACFRDC